MDLRECITRDTLNYFARTNEMTLTGPVRGVVLEFPGLGGGSCMGGVDSVGPYTATYGLRCSQENILLAYVFTGPWSWMNDQAVRIADAILDAIWDRYGLSPDIPVASTGGSMGGCGALTVGLTRPDLYQGIIILSAANFPADAFPEQYENQPWPTWLPAMRRIYGDIFPNLKGTKYDAYVLADNILKLFRKCHNDLHYTLPAVLA